MMDPDDARRGRRANALARKGIYVEEVSDVVGALKKLPEVAPDVLALSLENLPMDLDTLARGVASLPRLSHLLILGIGDSRPMSAQAHAQITIVPAQTPDEVVVRDIERLVARALKQRDAQAR